MPITQNINGFECTLVHRDDVPMSGTRTLCSGCPLDFAVTGVACMANREYPCTTAAKRAKKVRSWEYHWFSPVVYELNKE